MTGGFAESSNRVQAVSVPSNSRHSVAETSPFVTVAAMLNVSRWHSDEMSVVDPVRGVSIVSTM